MNMENEDLLDLDFAKKCSGSVLGVWILTNKVNQRLSKYVIAVQVRSAIVPRLRKWICNQSSCLPTAMYSYWRSTSSIVVNNRKVERSKMPNKEKWWCIYWAPSCALRSSHSHFQLLQMKETNHDAIPNSPISRGVGWRKLRKFKVQLTAPPPPPPFKLTYHKNSNLSPHQLT